MHSDGLAATARQLALVVTSALCLAGCGTDEPLSSRVWGAEAGVDELAPGDDGRAEDGDTDADSPSGDAAPAVDEAARDARLEQTSWYVGFHGGYGFVNLRVDLAHATTGWTAGVWLRDLGCPVTYGGAGYPPPTVTRDNVSIAIDVFCGTQNDFESYGYVWRDLELTRAADGGLASSGSAYGQETQPGGPATADVTVEPDREAPELTLQATSAHGPTDALLPWDGVTVETSEPLSNRYQAARLVAWSDGATVPTIYDASPTLADAWSERPNTFARSGQFTYGIFGAHDFAGNVASPVSLDFRLLDLGPAIGAHTFSTNDFGKWGAVLPIPAGDPACETDGCVAFGGIGECGRAGVAGRLVKGDDLIDVRFRLLAAVTDDTPFDATRASGVVSIDVARLGSTVETLDLRRQLQLEPLAQPVLGRNFGTPWTTSSGALSPLGEYAFAIWTDEACGGVPLTIIVDDVR